MAVVGTLNSSVAEKVAPILNSQKVVMISPANTNPALTQGTDPNNKARPFEYYFRVATTDLIQGPFAANFAYQTPGSATSCVIHDKKTYGQGLALQFKAQFEKLGGKDPRRGDRRTGGQGLLGRAVQDQALQPRHDLLRWRVPARLAC